MSDYSGNDFKPDPTPPHIREKNATLDKLYEKYGALLALGERNSHCKGSYEDKASGLLMAIRIMEGRA